ncbi:MAG: ComEC/Rec2-related protein [Verrucomicrobia bacterium]|nr:ComEC/Rec2-related protein [Verrucomicrobiota bacterium]
MVSRSLGHRAPLLWLVLPFMAGLAMGRARDLAPIGWLLTGAAIFSAGSVIAIRLARPRCWSFAIVLSMTLAGTASHSLHRQRLAVWDALPPREARVQVRVDRLFPQADPRKSVGLGRILRAESPLQELAGQGVYFSAISRRGISAAARGAIVETTGVIAALPRNPPVSTFDGYLANAGINFRLTRGRLLAEVEPPPAYRRFCNRGLEKLSAILGEAVVQKRPALVGILRAMLLGQQHELTPEQVLRFRQSGTMHVFSISGLHIAVISIGLHAMLSLLRLPRWAVLAFGLSALWLYVDLTGCAPSAVRAYVMVAFVEVALVLRLPRNPLSALTASALVVLLTAPLDLFSASFQMSYGIVAALLLLGLPLAERWLQVAELFRDLPKISWKRPRRLLDAAWRAVLSAMAIGVASSLVSAVTGAEFFQTLTPGALLANLWVIPVSSLVILLGLVSLLSGLAGFALGCSLANHAAVLVLWVVDTGVRLNLQVPAMWFTASFRLPGMGSVALVALMASMLAGYAAAWRGWSRGFWPPFAVVVLTLIFGLQFA